MYYYCCANSSTTVHVHVCIRYNSNFLCETTYSIFHIKEFNYWHVVRPRYYMCNAC